MFEKCWWKNRFREVNEMTELNTHLKRVDFLLSMIHMGVKDCDKDQVRSHLEDLSGYLVENDMLAE